MLHKRLWFLVGVYSGLLDANQLVFSADSLAPLSHNHFTWPTDWTKQEKEGVRERE